MGFKVTFKRNDGTEEYFDTFVSREYAYYHIAIAKMTSGTEGCRDYSDGEFIVTEDKFEE